MQEHKGDIWDGSNVLAVMAGSASDDLRYLKSVSLHIWLFGYEVTGMVCPACQLLLAFRAAAGHTGQSEQWSGSLCDLDSCSCADTLMVFTDKTLYVMTTNKKGK